MTESEAVEALRTALKSYLRSSFGGYELDRDNDFVVNRGSARVYVRPLEQEEHTFVLIWSVTNVGVSVTGELTRFLATENAGLAFGKLSLNETVPSVQILHSLPADFLNREELRVAVSSVAEAADEYDDRIRERFGGQRFTDAPAALPQVLIEAPQPPPGPPMATRSPALRTTFGLLSLAAAVGGGIVAYAVSGSIFLGLFVAVVALYLVAVAIAELVTGPHRLVRALYYLPLPALAVGLLAGSYALWGKWWLSVLIALLAAPLLDALIVSAPLTRVYGEDVLRSGQGADRRLPWSGK